MKKLFTYLFLTAIVAGLSYGFVFSPDNSGYGKSNVFINDNFSPTGLASQSPTATTIKSSGSDYTSFTALTKNLDDVASVRSYQKLTSL